jgi:hypothetical protein
MVFQGNAQDASNRRFIVYNQNAAVPSGREDRIGVLRVRGGWTLEVVLQQFVFCTGGYQAIFLLVGWSVFGIHVDFDAFFWGHSLDEKALKCIPSFYIHSENAFIAAVFFLSQDIPVACMVALPCPGGKLWWCVNPLAIGCFFRMEREKKQVFP